MRCGLPQFQYGAFINSFRRGAASLDMAPSAPARAIPLIGEVGIMFCVLPTS